MSFGVVLLKDSNGTGPLQRDCNDDVSSQQLFQIEVTIPTFQMRKPSQDVK